MYNTQTGITIEYALSATDYEYKKIPKCLCCLWSTIDWYNVGSTNLGRLILFYNDEKKLDNLKIQKRNFQNGLITHCIWIE
jgi:hypothetical protein